MKILDKGLDIDAFFAFVENSRARALMLDYDGTLAPFTEDRDRAYPYPGVSRALDGLMATGCRLVIVSGRAIEDLVPLLGMARTPELWGSHGWERMGPGGYEPPRPPERVLDGLQEITAWARENRLGEHFEQKPVGAAVHIRGMKREEADRLLASAAETMAEVALKSGLELHEFDGGVELRPPGRDKGHAVRTVLGELGPGAAAYLGDDLTDEDAFEAISGRGLGVLVRPELRPTAAGLWIRPPEELLLFIGRWSRACGG